MSKNIVFSCSKCSAQAPKWSGRCFDCGAWGTLKEEEVASAKSQPKAGAVGLKAKPAPVFTVKDLATSSIARLPVTGFPAAEIFPQGLAAGSLILLSGEPGAGKSTLALQLAQNACSAHKVIYFSAEEAIVQVKERAGRLGQFSDNFLLSGAQDVETLAATVRQERPQMIIVDSVQTIGSDEVEGDVGAVNLIKTVAGKLAALAQETKIAVIVIGHVTKDGLIAGPKSLEHVVDTVYLLAGDKTTKYRLLRSLKDRYGPSGRVQVMHMTSRGFRPVVDAAKIFIEDFKPKVGSALTIAQIEDRLFFLEVQALVSASSFGYAKRTATGFPPKRLAMILAIIKKHLRLDLDAYDVYINIAGGFQVTEPALDLAVALSLVSSMQDKILPEGSVVFGELGLAGELRPVSDTSGRLRQIEQNKFSDVYLPPVGQKISSRLRLTSADDLPQLLTKVKWQ